VRGDVAEQSHDQLHAKRNHPCAAAAAVADTADDAGDRSVVFWSAGAVHPGDRYTNGMTD